MQEKRKRKPLAVGIIILAAVSALLALFPSVHMTSFNGWTGESSSSTGNFYFGVLALWGAVEIASVFLRGVVGRVLGILAVLIKTVLPWMTFFMLKELGAIAMDASSTIQIINPLPYLVLGLCVVSLILQILLACKGKR